MAGLGSALHVNVPLSNYVIAWKPPADKATWFARGDFFPNVPVDKDSDIIRSISQGRMLQLYEALVGEDGLAGAAPVVDFALGPNITFKCKPAALRGILNYYKSKQADANLQFEKRVVEAPRFALEMWSENQALPTLLNSSNYGNNVTTLAAAAYWDNYPSSSSTIYDDLAYGLEQIWLSTGHKVNRLGMPAPVWRVIKGHPGLTRRPFNNQAGSSPQMLTTEIFEGLFKEWLEPGSVRIYNGYYDRNPPPNDGTDINTPVDGALFWGPSVVAAYVEPNVSLDDFSFGKSFFFAGLGDGQAAPMFVLERDAQEIMPIGGKEFRLVTSADWKITNATAGWIWPTVIDKTNARYNNRAGNSWFN